MFRELLARFGLVARYRTRMMDAEEQETAEELVEATVKDLQSAIEDINKMFGNKISSTITYSPLTRVSKMKSLYVYLKCYIVINEAPNIRIIFPEVVNYTG